MSDVLAHPPRHQVTDLTGTRRHPLVLTEQLALTIVGGEHRCEELDRAPGSPQFGHNIEHPRRGLLGHPGGIVRCPHPTRVRTHEQEVGDAVGMLHRRADASGPTVELSVQRGAVESGRVHDRDEIGRSLRDPVVVVTEVPVGDAATALVEHHHARELPEPAQELRLHREIPLVLEVRRLTLRHHEGDHPVAEDLVRDAHRRGLARSGSVASRRRPLALPPSVR